MHTLKKHSRKYFYKTYSTMKKIIYNVLLNIYRFRHCVYNTWKEFWFRDMFRLCFWNLLWQRDNIIYLRHLQLYTKPNFFVITTLIEVFNRELYNNMTGMYRVLDLWAYIWESSLYLSRYNTEVIAFEPSAEKFWLLEKNIAHKNNIRAFNAAVVDDPCLSEIMFHERDPFDFCSSSAAQAKLDTTVTVSCKDIFSLLDEYDFDGLKMDIEWWEFPILEALISKNMFTFQKWIIEFHFTGSEVTERRKFFQKFSTYLQENNYTLRVFDNDNVPLINQEDIQNVSCLNLEFKKKLW